LALQTGTPSKQMKKQTTNSILALETVKTFSKPAFGECALVLASTLLRGCQARGHFNRRSRPAVARTTDDSSFEPSEFELAGSQR
jgi:hypothetical protein